MPYDANKHGPKRIVGPGFHAQVYEIVQTVPEGWLTTYGDVAGAIGLRRAARQVGFALAALPQDREEVPWHRVVNAQGKLSVRIEGAAVSEQQRRLESEGFEVKPNGIIRNFADRRFVFEGPD